MVARITVWVSLWSVVAWLSPCAALRPKSLDEQADAMLMQTEASLNASTSDWVKVPALFCHASPVCDLILADCEFIGSNKFIPPSQVKRDYKKWLAEPEKYAEELGTRATTMFVRLGGDATGFKPLSAMFSRLQPKKGHMPCVLCFSGMSADGAWTLNSPPVRGNINYPYVNGLVVPLSTLDLRFVYADAESVQPPRGSGEISKWFAEPSDDPVEVNPLQQIFENAINCARAYESGVKHFAKATSQLGIRFGAYGTDQHFIKSLWGVKEAILAHGTEDLRVQEAYMFDGFEDMDGPDMHDQKEILNERIKNGEIAAPDELKQPP
mmetsp:Transcript_33039/g.77257  ORF Transcript_33039/g.77257 Transcript_33039/m.77257 type:complete len:324 (-) Transcript_33039:357-1328(-)